MGLLRAEEKSDYKAKSEACCKKVSTIVVYFYVSEELLKYFRHFWQHLDTLHP